MGGFVLLAALVGGVLWATASHNGPAVSMGGHNRVGYALTGYQDETLHYTIAGNVTRPLYPGGYSRIDLSFANPNSQSIPVPAGAVTITVTSRKGCPAHPNFKVVHTLTAPIIIGKDSTATLADLGITARYWPVIMMVTTPFTQAACEGTFYLHYSTGNDDDGG